MQIREVKEDDQEKIINLLKQLSNREIKIDLNFLISQKDTYCFVIEINNDIVATGTISFYYSLIKGKTGVIEDVVVDKRYRRQGLGRKIMKKLIEKAKKEKVKFITLTSNPKRIPARTLYQSLGFELKETGFFVLKI